MDVPMYLWAPKGYFDIEFPKKNLLCLILISNIIFARYVFPLGGVCKQFKKRKFPNFECCLLCKHPKGALTLNGDRFGI